MGGFAGPRRRTWWRGAPLGPRGEEARGALAARAASPAAQLGAGRDGSQARQELAATRATGHPRPKAPRHARPQRVRQHGGPARRRGGGPGGVAHLAHALPAPASRGPGAWWSPRARQRSVPLEARPLAIGSGQGERAGRRVIQRRCQGPRLLVDSHPGEGPEASAGRRQGRTGGREQAWSPTCSMPRAKLYACGTKRPAAIGNAPGRDASTFVAPRKKAA